MTSTVKPFRVDWYPKDALIDFSELTAEEIGICMQIINLIYHYQGPIINDPKSIGKKCSITRAKCERIIHKLIHKNVIYLTNDGKISQKRCLIELENIQKRREMYAKNGQKGAQTRWEEQLNQEDSHGNAILEEVASTNTDSSIKKDTSTFGGSAYQEGGGLASVPNSKSYDIDHHLSQDARDLARINAPRWDQQHLMRLYNKRIHKGDAQPPHSPDAAYPAWCKSYTKGKPPV